nr:ATP-binding protein [Halorhodospira halochloris]
MNYIIEHNRAAVAVHDTNMKYIYVSQRYLEDFNLEQEDIIGRHHYEVFPDLPEKWRQTHQKVLKGEVISADDDLYVTNEGKKYWTRWECRPWYKDDNSIGGLIIYTEVTNQRKETEEKLQFDLKLQKVIAEISANFAKTHEKELDNAINNSLARIGELFGIDRCYICLFSIGDNSITKTHEWRTSNHTASLKTPNKLLLTDIPWLTNKICSGERAYIPTLDDLPEEAQLEKDLLKFHNIHSVACLPILDDNLKPIGFMGLDMLSDNFTWPEQQICMLQVIAEIIGNTISRIEARRELKQREEQYRQLAERFREANSKLESAYRTKTDFLNAVSHDLRTPLNAILGFNELLLDSTTDPAQRHYLELCRSASNHLLGLIDTLLDLSRLESGKVKLNEERFHLRQLLSEQMQLLEIHASGKGLRLTWEIDEQIPEQVIGDSIRFCQVLFNLVINAIKFTDKGNVTVNVAAHDERKVIVSVADTGAGVPTALQENIFEPFQRGNINQQQQQGTGLGLAISRELTNLMGGEIWLESSSAAGTKFCFTAFLPPAPPKENLDNLGEKPANSTELSPQEDCTRSAKSADTTSPPVNLQVLVAEDEPTNALLIRALLEKSGANVTITENGREALKAWHENKPDLILLDYQMPEMNGPETASAIRANESRHDQKRSKIAMLSAHATDQARRECEMAGADTYLTKPIQRTELYKLLQWAHEETLKSPP